VTPADPVTWEPGPRETAKEPRQADAVTPWTIDLALAAAEALENSGRLLLAKAEAIRAGIRQRTSG
jgi:hypothetical protein